MFNIGPPELIVILLVALLIVGPKRLPEVGKSVGKALREIRRQTDEVRSSFEMNLDDDGDNHDESANEPVHDVTSSAPMAGADADDTVDAGWDATAWDTGADAEAPADASNDAGGTDAVPAASEPAVSEPVEPAASDEQGPEPDVPPEPVPAAGGRRRRRGRRTARPGPAAAQATPRRRACPWRRSGSRGG